MKKIVLMALVLILGCTGLGFAEEETTYIGYYTVLVGEEYEADFDGDGAMDTLSWEIEYDEKNYVETVYLNVADENSRWGYFSELYMASVYVLDVDGDGSPEIFVAGDEMSYDFKTVCLKSDAQGEMEVIPFANPDATGEEDAELMFGSGMLMEAGDGKIVLTGTQDILGTYLGSRTYALEDGRFVLADDGLWRFEREYIDEESWEYAGIAPNQDIPVTFVAEDGAESEGVIAAGERFMITASDKVSVAYFVMEDGRTGYFAVEPDVETGYGVKVNGISENELFDSLPYAG